MSVVLPGGFGRHCISMSLSALASWTVTFGYLLSNPPSLACSVVQSYAEDIAVLTVMHVPRSLLAEVSVDFTAMVLADPASQM